MQKEAQVNINSIVTASGHPKSIIASLKSTNGLPFREVLSPEVLAESINIPYRERYDFYSPEITLWAFLSQALDADQSLDAAVKRVIAFHLAMGHDYNISSNTAAFSKTRSRLPEEIISNLARDSAEKMEEIYLSLGYGINYILSLLMVLRYRCQISLKIKNCILSLTPKKKELDFQSLAL